MMKIIGHNITLRLADVTDAAFIVRLRTDPQLSQHISPTDGRLETQTQWLQHYRAREAAGQEYYFIIVGNEGQDSIGTTRLYNFNGKRFKSGSWIVMPGIALTRSVESYQLSLGFAFTELGFGECAFEVRKANTGVNRFHRQVGALVTGEDDENFYYLLTKPIFFQERQKLIRLLGLAANAFDHRIEGDLPAVSAAQSTSKADSI